MGRASANEQRTHTQLTSQSCIVAGATEQVGRRASRCPAALPTPPARRSGTARPSRLWTRNRKVEGCAGTEVGRSAAKQHRGSRQQALASFVRTAWLNCTSAGAQLPNLPAIKPPVGGGRGLMAGPPPLTQQLVLPHDKHDCKVDQGHWRDDGACQERGWRKRLRLSTKECSHRSVVHTEAPAAAAMCKLRCPAQSALLHYSTSSLRHSQMRQKTRPRSIVMVSSGGVRMRQSNALERIEIQHRG